jgi:hypothetical protein
MDVAAALDAVAAAYAWLATKDGELAVWGVFTRGLGLLLFISLISWVISLRALAGVDGMTPADAQLRAYKRDFGLLKALVYWPSIMWGMLLVPRRLRNAYLTAVPAIGCAAGVVIMLGGSWSPYAFIVGWVCLVSIDNGAAALMFPWDSLLLEASFLALWLPATHTLLPTAVVTAGQQLSRAATCTVAAPALRAVLGAATADPLLGSCFGALPLWPAALHSFAGAVASAAVAAVAAVMALVPLAGPQLATLLQSSLLRITSVAAVAPAAVPTAAAAAGPLLAGPSVAALAVPNPLHAFMFRYLLVRVLLGFGKMKFTGSSWRDRTYIKTFLMNQPIVSPLGFIANRLLPDWFWVFSLGECASAVRDEVRYGTEYAAVPSALR